MKHRKRKNSSLYSCFSQSNSKMKVKMNLFNSLPDDLLTLIFQYVMDQCIPHFYIGNNVPITSLFLCQIAFVCHRWWMVCKNLPEANLKLDLSFGSYKTYQQNMQPEFHYVLDTSMVKYLLNLSKNFPKVTKLNIWCNNNGIIWDTGYTFPVNYCHCKWENVFNVLLQFIQNWPYLLSLDIHGDSFFTITQRLDNNKNHLREFLVSLASSCPKIKHLHIFDIQCSLWDLSLLDSKLFEEIGLGNFNNLQALTLDDDPPIQIFKELAYGCPHLKELIIEHYVVPIFDDTHKMKDIISSFTFWIQKTINLQVLKIHFCSLCQNGDYIGSSIVSEYISRSVARHSSFLRCLSLHDADIQPSTIMEILSSCHQLETIDIQFANQLTIQDIANVNSYYHSKDVSESIQSLENDIKSKYYFQKYNSKIFQLTQNNNLIDNIYYGGTVLLNLMSKKCHNLRMVRLAHFGCFPEVIKQLSYGCPNLEYLYISFWNYTNFHNDWLYTPQKNIIKNNIINILNKTCPQWYKIEATFPGKWTIKIKNKKEKLSGKTLKDIVWGIKKF